LLESLNDKFRQLASKGFLDEDTMKSVLLSNPRAVDDFWATTHTTIQQKESHRDHHNSAHKNVVVEAEERTPFLPTHRQAPVVAVVATDSHTSESAKKMKVFTPPPYTYASRSLEVKEVKDTNRGRSLDRKVATSSSNKKAWRIGSSLSPAKAPISRIDVVHHSPTSMTAVTDKAQYILLHPSKARAATVTKPWLASLRS
jgi:hypothetical protein